MEDLDERAIKRKLRALKQAPSNDVRVLTLRAQLAWAISLQQRSRARQISEEVLALATEADEELPALLARRNLAYSRYIDGSFTDGLTRIRKVIEGFRRIDHGPGLLSALDISSHGLEALGDYARAYEVNLEVLELAEKLERPREKAWAHTNIATINVLTGDLDGALGGYKKALGIFQRIQYPVGVARVKSLIGDLYAREDKVHEALAVHIESLQLYRDLRVNIGEALALMDIGAILERLGRPDDAIRRYRMAIGMFAKIESVTSQGRAEIRIGRLLLDNEAFPEARGYLEAAREHLDGKGALVDEMEVYRLLARLETAEGRYEAATRYHENAVRVSDRVNDSEKRAALERIKTRLEIERAEKDAEIHRLKYVELAKMQAKLMETERLAVVGDLAAGVAHEVNNPLGVLRSNLDLLSRAAERIEGELGEAKNPKTRRSLRAMTQSVDSALEATNRIDGLVKSLKRFSKLDESRRQTFDLNEEIKNVMNLVRPRLSESVALEADLEPIPPVEGVPSEINQVLMTLLVNAAEATSEGAIRIRTSASNGGVAIHLVDTGRGMSPELVGRLFEPDLSPDGSRVRFRVGLPSARAAIQRHGGDIAVSSVLGRGTEFEVHLPVRPPSG